MTAAVRARRAAPTQPPRVRRDLSFDDTQQIEADERLVLRLDDVSIPPLTLRVHGLRPTVGSLLYGLLFARRSPRSSSRR
jgi:hypothetical protein